MSRARKNSRTLGVMFGAKPKRRKQKPLKKRSMVFKDETQLGKLSDVNNLINMPDSIEKLNKIIQIIFSQPFLWKSNDNLRKAALNTIKNISISSKLAKILESYAMGKTQKTDYPNVWHLGGDRYRIRWWIYDSTNKQRFRQKDITAKSEKEAKQALDDINYEIRHQTYIDKSSKTVGEQVQDWYKYHQSEVEDKTRTRYEQSIRLHIIPGLGHIRLQDLTKQHVEDFYLSVSRKDGKEGELSKGTLAWIHTTLKQALEDAIDDGLIGKNPMRKIKAPKGAGAGEVAHPLNQDQAASFLEQARKDRFFELWFSYLATGMRPEELLGLKRTRIDLRNKTITIQEVVICDKKGKMVPKPIPKTKKSHRTIKISDAAVEVLKAQLAKVDAWKEKCGPKLFKDKVLVFPSETGGYLNPSNLRLRHFKPILQAAGLPDIRPYDLRHTHAVLFFLQCKDMDVVSKRLGHDDVAFTWKTYYHFLPGADEEAVAKFDSVLTGMLPTPETLPDKAS